MKNAYGCIVPVLLLIGGCSHLPTPNDYYAKQGAVFGEATDSLATAAQGELDSFRTSRRLREAQVAAWDYMNLVSQGSTQTEIMDSARQRSWLCGARGVHALRVHDREFVQGVAKVMKSLTAAPSDDYKKLFAALFEDYHASFPKPGGRVVDGQKREAAVTGECERDYREYLVTTYPQSVDPSVEGLADIKTAWDAVWGVLKPLVTEGLSIADRLRRGEAIREYFANKDNVKDLKDAITRLNQLVRDAEVRKRHAAMVKYVRESQDLFGESTLAANTAALLARSSPNKNCAAWSGIPADKARERMDRQKVVFQRCYAEVVQAWEPVLQKALTAAAEYDTVADLPASKAGVELQKAVDNLAELAKAEPSEELLKSLYALAISMRDYAKKLEDATKSAENRKKVDELLQKLKSELKI